MDKNNDDPCCCGYGYCWRTSEIQILGGGGMGVRIDKHKQSKSAEENTRQAAA